MRITLKDMIRLVTPPMFIQLAKHLLAQIRLSGVNQDSKHSLRGQNVLPGSVEYQIGNNVILLPENHALGTYQKKWKRYDVALGEISKAIFEKYPHGSAIDIGANVGDSAALLCKYQSVKTLCVEGNPLYLKFLLYNVKVIGADIEIEECFIGADNAAVNLGQIVDHAGTSSILNAVYTRSNDEPDISSRTMSLDSLIAKHPLYSNARLLKIDTDGYDFQIITESAGVLRHIQPIVFFECAPFENTDGVQQSLQCFQSLVSSGYSKFIVYDNHGNYLVHLTASEFEKFKDLIAYLCLNHKYGSSVYYFDICAFTPLDEDVFTKVRSMEIELALSDSRA